MHCCGPDLFWDACHKSQISGPQIVDYHIWSGECEDCHNLCNVNVMVSSHLYFTMERWRLKYISDYGVSLFDHTGVYTPEQMVLPKYTFRKLPGIIYMSRAHLLQ